MNIFRGAAVYQILNWFGIFGTAISLFSNIQSLLDLSPRAKLLIAQWHHLQVTVWHWLFSLVAVPAEQVFSFELTFPEYLAFRV